MARKTKYDIIKPWDVKLGQICYLVGCCLHQTKRSADKHLKELQKANIEG